MIAGPCMPLPKKKPEPYTVQIFKHGSLILHQYMDVLIIYFLEIDYLRT
jgi:hypothetical protein